MSSDEEITIAFLYKRSGKPALSESDLYLALSMDLGWMTATEAKTFVHHIKDTRLVSGSDDNLTPTFDIHAIAIPRGFTPSKQPKKDEPPAQNIQESVVDQILKRISSCTNRQLLQLTEEASALAHEKTIHPEVAALWLARRYGCDTAEFYDAAEKTLISK